MESPETVAVLLERLARILQNEAHAAGLKPTQWEALRYLARANRFSRSPSALTAYLGTTKGTVSQTLMALERKGLVAKAPDAAHRRHLHIDLTPEGERLLRQDPIAAVMRSAEQLPEQQRRHLAETLSALLTDMLRQRQGRPFGVCRTCRFFQTQHPEGGPHRCGLLGVALSADDSQRICVEQEPGP